jgi:hypothetical protein
MYKNGKINISESEMLKIKQMYGISEKEKTVTETKNPENSLNEVGGAVGRGAVNIGKNILSGLKKLFTKSDDKILQYASNEINKSISTLVKSNTKQVSLSAIRSTSNYKKSLSALVEDLSVKRFNKSYKELKGTKEGLQLIKDTTKQLDELIKKELEIAGKQLVSKIDTLKGVRLTKMGSKTAQITKTINALNKTKYTKATTLLKNNAKLIGEGKQGAKILSDIKSGKINIVKGGQLYSGDTKTLGQSNIKVFKLSRGQIKTLALLGITGAAIVYLIGKLHPNDTVAVVDDNGDDASSDNSGGGTPDDGKKTGSQTFRPCTDFPFTFGCKNEAIKEVQKCLGMEEKYQTGNFGPVTLNYLETKRGENTITKEIYDSIIKSCKQSTEPTTGETQPTTGETQPTEPTTGETQPTEPTTGETQPTTGETQPTEPKVTLDNENIKEILGNINKRRNYYVYKGRDLMPNEQKWLRQYMEEKGFGVFRPKERFGPNDKYYFRKK